jgi:hypothetical protein
MMDRKQREEFARRAVEEGQMKPFRRPQRPHMRRTKHGPIFVGFRRGLNG